MNHRSSRYALAAIGLALLAVLLSWSWAAQVQRTAGKPPAQPAGASLVGTWKLVSIDERNAQRRARGADGLRPRADRAVDL